MSEHTPDAGCFCPSCARHYSLHERLGRGAVNYEDLRAAFRAGWVHAAADIKRGMRTAEDVDAVFDRNYLSENELENREWK